MSTSTHKPMSPRQLRDATWAWWTAGVTLAVLFGIAGMIALAVFTFLAAQTAFVPLWLAHDGSHQPQERRTGKAHA